LKLLLLRLAIVFAVYFALQGGEYSTSDLFRQRQRERMLAALKKGDRVVTSSGLHGTVASLDEHRVVLRVADQVRLEFDRASIGRVLEAQGEKNA